MCGNDKIATLLPSYKEIQTTTTRNYMPLEAKQSIGTTYDRSKKIPHWNFTAKKNNSFWLKASRFKKFYAHTWEHRASQIFYIYKDGRIYLKRHSILENFCAQNFSEKRKTSTRDTLWNRPIISFNLVYKKASVGKLHFSDDIPCSVMH